MGNKVFAAAYDLAVPNSWRVVNTKDVIPRVPRLMGYSHVGRCIVLKEDGSLDIDGTRLIRFLSSASLIAPFMDFSDQKSSCDVA